MSKINTGSKRVVANYSPDQARDEQGRFSSEAHLAAKGATQAALKATERTNNIPPPPNKGEKMSAYHMRQAKLHERYEKHASSAWRLQAHVHAKMKHLEAFDRHYAMGN